MELYLMHSGIEMDHLSLRLGWRALLVFILFSLVANPILASENIAKFKLSEGHMDLQPYLEILLPENVTDGRFEKDSPYYVPLDTISNNFGFNGKPVWIKFSVERINGLFHSTEHLYLELESPILDFVTLYAPQGDGIYRVVATGDELSMSSRDVQFRDFLFRLPITGNTVDTYYLQINSKGTVQLPLKLWSETRLIEHVDQNSMLLGGYFSVLAILLLMASVAYVHFRQKVLLFYITYLLSYFFLQFSLNGLSFQYFWPNVPIYAGKLNALAIGGAIIGGLLFCAEYLQINRKRYPILSPVIASIFFAVLVGCGVIIQGQQALGASLLILCGMLLLPTIILVAYVAYQNGVKRAKGFIFAWMFLLVAVFISGLHYLGLVPYTHITFYAMPVGSLIEMTILCFVTIYNIGELKREKEHLSERASEYLRQLHFKVDELVSERTKQLEEKNSELEKRASLDSMTGLLNHSTIKEFLQVAKRDAFDTKQDLAIILIDIDEFKQINDTFGHLAGDDVIRSISSIIESSVRSSDFCGRYGGDEFMLILPGASIDVAMRIAETIREQASQLTLASMIDQTISVSIGVSILNKNNNNMIEEADAAMYRSKKEGRNRVNAYNLSLS